MTHHTRHIGQMSRVFALTILTATIAVGTPGHANDGNPPALQAKLKRAAAAVTPLKKPGFEITGATIGPRQLIIHHKTAIGTDPAFVFSEFSKIQWESAYCGSIPLLQFMKDDNVAIVISFEKENHPNHLKRTVTYRSCTEYIASKNVALSQNTQSSLPESKPYQTLDPAVSEEKQTILDVPLTILRDEFSGKTTIHTQPVYLKNEKDISSYGYLVRVIQGPASSKTVVSGAMVTYGQNNFSDIVPMLRGGIRVPIRFSVKEEIACTWTCLNAYYYTLGLTEQQIKAAITEGQLQIRFTSPDGKWTAYLTIPAAHFNAVNAVAR